MLANAMPGFAPEASGGRQAAGSLAGAFIRAAARGARGALNCKETLAESSPLKSAASLAPLAAAGCSGAKLPIAAANWR